MSTDKSSRPKGPTIAIECATNNHGVEDVDSPDFVNGGSNHVETSGPECVTHDAADALRPAALRRPCHQYAHIIRVTQTAYRDSATMNASDRCVAHGESGIFRHGCGFFPSVHADPFVRMHEPLDISRIECGKRLVLVLLM